MTELKQINLLLSGIDGAYHDTAAHLKLSDSALRILYTLWDEDGTCPLSHIVRVTGISKQTINSCLRRLEADGVLYLEAVDSRRKNVCLTPSGKALAANTAGRLMQIEEEIYASWSQEDLAAYLKLNQRYLDQFKEKTKELFR